MRGGMGHRVHMFQEINREEDGRRERLWLAEGSL